MKPLTKEDIYYSNVIESRKISVTQSRICYSFDVEEAVRLLKHHLILMREENIEALNKGFNSEINSGALQSVNDAIKKVDFCFPVFSQSDNGSIGDDGGERPTTSQSRVTDSTGLCPNGNTKSDSGNNSSAVGDKADISLDGIKTIIKTSNDILLKIEEGIVKDKEEQKNRLRLLQKEMRYR